MIRVRHAPRRWPARRGAAKPDAAAAPAVDEAVRLRALHALDILDTPRERGFDRLVFMAAQTFRTPIAAVSFVGQDRQWFKARVGLQEAETPRSLSFCVHALGTPQPMVVPDARRDPRFRGNPLVTGSHRIRFYAGAPLSDPDGLRVGTLCILDTRPRTLTGSQVATLAMLAQEVSTLLAARRPARDTLTPADSPWLEG